MDLVVPTFMADAVEKSLASLYEEVGGIDQFVQKELGYATPEEMYAGLADAQVDGVALAIHSIQNGKGFVLGDATGIGKGRQCAALIRWAKLHGITPVYLTMDPKLFSDTYFDGRDIGSTFNPLLVASNEKAKIVDREDRVVQRMKGKRDATFREFLDGQSQHDCVFVTYSQLQKAGKQQTFLQDLVQTRKCLFILDEAHQAAGDSARGKFFYGDNGILHNPNASVVYASATFAKRPDNMALYFRTSIGNALDNIANLEEVLTRGGVPLQQMMSEGLASNGEMIRRERDFTGVSFETIVALPDGSVVAQTGEQNNSKLPAMQQLAENYDRVADVLGQLVNHSNRIKRAVKEKLKQENRYGSSNTREDVAVQMASFSSVTHNYIAQVLLASKCDIVVDRAIQAVKKGEKPVIALTNTLESVLGTYVAEHGIQNGEELQMGFADVLEAALDRMYKATEKDDAGGNEKISTAFTAEELGVDKADARIREAINDLRDLKLPISPIDYIKQKLEAAGIKVGEITGRTLTVDYSGETPKLSKRDTAQKDKNKNVNDFNSGKTDCIILNQSGSTGLSLHASERFKDQKVRHMIMAQPSLDIAVVQQMFGRILRSGQVVLPSYEILSSPLAAEKRPTMVLSRKLQSLNANTTANNKGAVSLGLDFMNRYGDIVAQQFLNENPDIASWLDLDTNDDATKGADDLMTKLTGKMAILPDAQQQAIYDELSERYNDYVEFLKKTGNYDLEVSVHDDWDARTVSEDELSPGKKDGSMFEQPVTLKKINIQEQKNIRSAAEVKGEIEKNIGGNTLEKLDAAFSGINAAIENLAQAYSEEERSEGTVAERKENFRNTVNKFTNFILRYKGQMLELKIGEDIYTGTVTGFRLPKKIAPRSPITASKIVVEFAVTDAAGKLSIPYSRLSSGEISFGPVFFGIDSSFTGEKTTIRTERYAVTGNLLRGIEYAEAGKVVSYKTHDGQVESALLLPKTWEPRQLARDPRNELHSVKDVMAELNTGDGRFSMVSGNNITLYKRWGIYEISVPKAKRTGGVYFLDEQLRNIVGDFSSAGNQMRVSRLTEDTLKKAIERILEIPDSNLRRIGDARKFSLKLPHQQVNPIREAGAIRDQHQARIDQEYTVRPNTEVNRDAERTIERFGGIQGAINAIAVGDYTPISDTAQRVVQVVLNSKEYKDSDVETRGKIADIYINHLGTEAARALAARRLGALNLADLQSIQAHVNAFVAKIDQKKPDNKLREQILKEFGFDIDALPDEVLKDQGKLDALIRKLAAERANRGDKLYEYWINAILSGPSTHAANVLGNTANAAYELGIKRFTEALINTVAHKKDGATFGEFREMLHAIDWRNAFRRAKLAYDYEALSVDGGKLEQVRTAIGGKWGQRVRTFTRLLRAADEFAKTLIQPVEAAAMAYREANASGLKGTELRTYIENALKDDTSSANEFGRQRALELTFQEDPGVAVKALIRLREKGGALGWLLKYTLPFIKTPTNILKQGLRKSPLGTVNLAWETGKIALGKGKFDSKYVSRLAEQLIAWGAVAMLMGMDDDDDLPFLTGSSPQYGSNEAKFKANKIPPYSIRIGGKYFSYKRIEPFATSLAVLADGMAAFRAAKRGEDGTKVMQRMMGNMWRMVAEKSFLDSLGEINRVVRDPERSLMNSATNFAAGWVPNFVRQTLTAYDDNVRDTKSRAKGQKWWEDQFDVFTTRLGFQTVAPKRDYFGREVKKDSVSGPWWLARLIPIKYVDPGENVNRAERLMMRYNQAHPNDEYYPGIPAYYFQRDGQKLYMEGANYDEFQKRSGELAHKQIENAFRHGLLNASNPSEKDIKLIKKIFTRARKNVRDQMYKEKKYSR